MSTLDFIEEYHNGTHQLEKMPQDEIMRQVLPSFCNKRFEQKLYSQAHEDFMNKKEKEFSKKGFSFEAVRYGEREKEVYDVIRPERVTVDTPVILFFHGGYWMAMSRSSMHGASEAIVQKGGICVCVGYDLAPQVSMSVIMEEACRAMEHLLRVTFKSHRNIYLWAHCAGVVNALWGCCYGDLAPKDLQSIKGLVLSSGVYDMRPVSMTTENLTLRMTPDEVCNFNFVSEKNVENVVKRLGHCKLLLTISEFESKEFYRQQNFYEKMLKQRGLQVESVIFPGWDHVEVVEMMCQADSAITKVLIEFMGLSG